MRILVLALSHYLQGEGRPDWDEHLYGRTHFCHAPSIIWFYFLAMPAFWEYVHGIVWRTHWCLKLLTIDTLVSFLYPIRMHWYCPGNTRLCIACMYICMPGGLCDLESVDLVFLCGERWVNPLPGEAPCTQSGHVHASMCKQCAIVQYQ